MAVDLKPTQDYLNAKLGTVGLTKQQCLQRLFGAAGSLASNPMTAQDAALNYAGLNSRTTIQNALERKAGIPIVAAIDQQQTTNSAAEIFGNNTVGQKIAQSFLPSLGRVTGLTFQRRNSTGTYIGDVTISIQTDANGIPSGTNIYITTIANATWEAITELTDSSLAFSAGLNLGGAPYWIVFESSTLSVINRPNLAGATGNLYLNGGIKAYNGTTWIASTDDLYFKINCEVVEAMSTQEAARRL